MPNARSIDVTKAKLKVLVWGPPGGGKTWFAGTFPKPFVFDFDGGITTLTGLDVEYERFDPKDPQAYRAFDLRLKAFETNPPKERETVVLDSLTTLQEVVETQVQMVNGHIGQPMQLQEWGQVIDKLTDTMYRMCHLVEKGYHIVVTAHEQIEKDEVLARLVVRPLVVGKALPARLPLWFDEVYYAYGTRGKDSKTAYYLQTQPDALHLAKSRHRGALEALEPQDFQHIYRKIVAHHAIQSTPSAPTT